MADQTPTNSDEIDLGQLFQILAKGFNKVFKAFLSFYLYLKKNIFILVGLIILGVATGFGLKQLINEELKIEVIVRPNMESRNYLYEVVDEIQANIKAEDTLFFKDLDIPFENLKDFEITIESLGDTRKTGDKGMAYLELLKGFEGSSEAISDIIRAEILSKSTLINHKISFYFKDSRLGEEYAKKLMIYINSNPYFNDLASIYHSNATERIQKNKELVAQIDNLISNYTQKLAQNDTPISDGRISFDTEEKIDVKGLFELKSSLIREIESKNIELKTRTEAIKVINFGKPQEVKIALFGKSIILMPLIFLSLFFLISIVKYLNRKILEI